MNRRQLLKITAGVGTMGVAGCNTNNESTTASTTQTQSPVDPSAPTTSRVTENETPSTKQMIVKKVSGPESPVAQARPFKVTATVVNRGSSSDSQAFIINIGDELVTTAVFSLDAGAQATRTFILSVPCAGSHEVHVGTATTTVSVNPYPKDFVKTSGRHFTIAGNPIYFNGANSWGLHFASDVYIADIMRDAAVMGLDVLRTHVYHDGNCKVFGGVSCKKEFGQFDQIPDEIAFQKEPGKYSDLAFRKFDRQIVEAKRQGLRLIVSLAGAGHDPDMTGTIPWYVKHATTTDSFDDFFTNNELKSMFKEWIHDFLNRRNHLTGVKYKNEPTIMLWEIGNELKFRNTTGKPDVLAEWYDEIATYIKSITSQQLVSTGTTGLYRDTQGVEGRTDFHLIHESPAIDATTFHIYPSVNVTTLEEVDQMAVGAGDNIAYTDYIRRFTEDSHNMLKKPIYAGEYNIHNHDRFESIDRMAKIRNAVYRRFHEAFLEYDLDGALFFGFVSDDYFDHDTAVRWGWDRLYQHIRQPEFPIIVNSFADKIDRKGSIHKPPVVSTTDFVGCQ